MSIVFVYLYTKGIRLPEDINPPEQLNVKPAETKIFGSGCVGLDYIK